MTEKLDLVCQHALKDRGAATAGRVANQERQRIERSEVIQSGAHERFQRAHEPVLFECEAHGSYMYSDKERSLDSIIVGYYRGEKLIYVARVRNGFVPASRRRVFEKLHPLLMGSCPFVNLPETHKGWWGDGLTAKDMEKCVWVRPELVAKIEFLEGTESDHLRHAKFAGLREDKNPRSVIKEEVG